MAVNIFQVGDINTNLFSNSIVAPNASTTGVYASEYPLLADNFNGQLSRYTKIMGVWPSNLINSVAGYPAGTGGNDSWAQPNGAGYGAAWRPNGGYFARGVYTTDQNPPSSGSYLSYGYIGSFVGGYDALEYTHDMNPGPVTSSQVIAVDYEPPYGHGAGTGIAVAPISNVYTNEWRDSNNLPQDPSASVTVNSSAYNRDPYSAPAFFVLNIDSPTTTLGSSNVQFHVEMRPTYLMTAFGGSTNATPPNGSRAPLNTGHYKFYPFTGVRKFGSRALSIFMGRIFDGQGNMFAYPLYEDGTYATFVSGSTTYADLVYSGTAIDDCPTSRPPVVTGFWTPGTNFALTAAATAVGGVTAYTGTFPVIPIPGSSIHITGFTTPANNGTFTVATGSTSTTLYVFNGAGVAETHAATAANVVALNYEVMDFKGHIQKATTAGTSGTVLPAFNTSGGTVADGFVVWTDQGVYTRTTYITDARIRQMAHQTVNNEYYTLVQETKFGIFSNKTTTYPLVFMDLIDTWNTGTWAQGFRIGGSTTWSCSVLWQPAHAYTVGQAILDPFGFIQVVTSIAGSGTSGNTTPFTLANAPGATTTDNSGGNQVVWTNEGLNKSKIFFIAENGHLAVFDANVTNGIVNNLTAAPALTSGQAYGALRIPNGSSTLYAVTGCFSPNPAVSSTDAGSPPNPGFVGVSPYNIVAGTWSAPSFPAYHARHNARSVSEMITLRNGWLALMVERVNVVSTTVTNTAAGGGPDYVDWQVMLFNPTTTTWNTNQIYSDGTTNFSFGTPSGSGNNSPLYYEDAYNCSLFDVAPTVVSGTSPVILIQSNWRNDKLFVLDGSQSLASISNTNVTNVSQGSAYDLLTGVSATSQPNISGTPVPSPLQIKKSATDDRTIFWFNEFYNFVQTNSSTPSSVPTWQVYQAPPSWVLSNWNGGTGLAIVSYNTKDNNGNVSTIAKDKMWLGDNCNEQGFGDPWSFLGHFVDNTIVTIIHGEVASSGEFGLLPSSSPIPLLASHNWLAQFFLPTYFKWASYTLSAATTASFGLTAYTGTFSSIPVVGTQVTIAGFGNAPNNGTFTVATGSTSTTLYVFNGAGVAETHAATAGQFIMANNWADATTNSAPVSATSGTNITLPYGLIGQFGTTSGSSYAQNEWHTINLTWGNTKFVRKARYTWAMFAGQTFLTTQTVPMTATNNVIPSVILPEAFGSGNIAFSYPTNVPVAAPGPTNTWSYGGGPTGVAATIDGYLTSVAFPMTSGGAPQNSPVQMTLTVHHPDVTTILNRPNQSGQAYGANSSQAGSLYGPYPLAFNGNPQTFWSSNLTGPGSWIAIDLGAAQTCRSYSFTTALFGTNTGQNQTMSGWTLYGSNNSTAGNPSYSVGTWTAVDTRSGITASRAFAGNVASPGSYRYYALVSNTLLNSYTALGLFRLFSSTMQSTMNFSEITAFGPYFLANVSTSMTARMMRGMTFEVSTNGGSTYTTIYPLWRIHMGGVWCFSRQTGVTNIRITAQTGYPYYNYINYNSLGGSGSFNNYLAFGPFQFTDYSGAETTGSPTGARLGLNTAPVGTPQAGTFDPNCMGIAVDAVSISVDATVSAASLSPQYTGQDYTTGSSFGLSPLYGWWTWTQVPTGSLSTFPNGFYRVHPFFGFVLFGGPAGNSLSYAGGSDQVQVVPGTNMVITYHWGRRV